MLLYSYHFLPVVNGMWTHLLRRLEHVYFQNQNPSDKDQNYRYHNREQIVHNQHHPNRHKFELLDQMPYHLDIRNENLVPKIKSEEKKIILN